MSFTDQENQVLFISVSTCAGLSLIFSSIVVLMYLTFPELRTFGYRLVTYLSICDILVSIVYITPITPEIWCIIKACILVYGSTGRVILTYIIANSVYKSYTTQDHHVEKYEKRYFLSANAILLVIIALPFTTDSYGNADTTCWIEAKGDDYIQGNIWRGTLFYFPYIIITILVVSMYVKIIRSMKESLGKEVSSPSIISYTSNLIKRLRILPVFNFAVLIPGMVNRTYDLIWPDDPSIHLVMIADILEVSLGFANAVLFLHTPNVRCIISRIIFPKKNRTLLIQSTISS
jgi:hypothetical protein